MTDAPLTLHLGGALPQERIARLTRDLARDLAREGIAGGPVEHPAAPGERGEPVTLGVLALALIKSGAVVALVRCLQAYLAREPSLSVELQRSDGSRLKVTAQNLGSAEFRRLVEAASEPRAG